MRKGSIGRGVLALAAVAAALGATGTATATPAQAAVVPDNTCPTDFTVSQPFAAWGDVNHYRPLEGGDFEAPATSWTLTGGAAVVGGGDPFGLTGTASTGALELPAGATAQSPDTCVDSTQPTFRFVAGAASAGASVSVSVVHLEPTAGTLIVPVGMLTADGDWQPSPQYQNGQAVAGLLRDGTAQMAVRLTARTGTTRVDDVFVDPRMRW